MNTEQIYAAMEKKFPHNAKDAKRTMSFSFDDSINEQGCPL